MKKIIVVISLIVSVLSCKKETRAIDVKKKNVTTIKKDEMPKKKVLSPHATAMAIVGDAHIHIDYSSPGVRDRIIFGGLLSYDMVWQAGAHNATWLETNQDLIIDGKTLPAGKYGFFTIPSKKEWTIIFNTNWDQHGKDEYDEKEDVLRFKVVFLPLVFYSVGFFLGIHPKKKQCIIMLKCQKLIKCGPVLCIRRLCNQKQVIALFVVWI
jgi:hypothetical protein